MKINFALIADTLLAALCSFIFIFTLTRYYTHNLTSSLALGISAGVCAGAGTFFYIRRKQHKKLLFGKEAEEKRKLAMHLCILSYSKACGLIATAVGGLQKTKRIECENEIYFPVFKAEPCNMDDILPALRMQCKDKQKIIVCNALTENAKKLAENCGVKIWDCADIYRLLKKANALPETYLYAEPKKLKLLKRIRLRFTRKICLPAFWSGAALMFMSYFTFFPVYYIISGAIMLCICVAAAIFGQPKSI